MNEVTTALQSENGWFIAILIAIIIVLVIVGARHGLLKIKTDKIMVGIDASSTTQEIIRSQMQWSRIAIQAFGNNIDASTKLERLKLNFCIEKVINMFVEWIILNHMSDDKEYIKVRQEAVWNLLNIYADKDELKTANFKKEVYAAVEYIIKNLVRIKNNIEKEAA